MVNIMASVEEGVESIREKGFYVHPHFIDPKGAEQILAEAGFLNLEVNANDVSVVITKGGQRFLTHCLARSAAAFEIVCSDFILQLAERLLGESFRLIAKRIYSTPPNFHMQWHTDADLRQTPRGDCPALTFILYLTDVVDGEFELIEKSDRWDPQKLGLDDGVEISDKFVEKNFAEQVRRFPMNRGGMIIYNARVVHRATPMRAVSSPHRKSLYFQINRGQACGEPILVNTEFLHMLDARRQMLLGFGGRSNAPSFPSPPKTLQYWPDEDLEGLCKTDWARVRRLLK